MSQTQWFLLPHEGGIARHQPGWGKDGKILAALRHGMFQLIGNIEMIFDDALSAAGDKDHLLNASLQGFIYGILNERPIHDRQHFIGNDLRRGQESCDKSSDRKDGFSNLRPEERRVGKKWESTCRSRGEAYN